MTVIAILLLKARRGSLNDRLKGLLHCFERQTIRLRKNWARSKLGDDLR